METVLEQNNNKHTPGPWKTKNGKFYTKVVSENLNRVIFCSQTQGNTVEDHANSKLLAAAPELLEALETIRKSSLEHISLVDDKEKMAELIFLHNIADKTIAKVKGIL